MATAPKLLALVLAGGEGSRLSPLTEERSKPSVPFAGRYRIVDFVLSNFVNSQIFSIYLLVQYKSQSLIEHARKAWTLSPVATGHFVTVVPPQMRAGSDWFQGTADAVYQNLRLIYKHRPDIVAVFGADHVYRMDLRQMIRFHQERRAEVTVAAIPVPLSETKSFGIIGVDDEDRITEFQEKPEHGRPMPKCPDKAYASMGNYLFERDVLLEALEDAHRLGEKDFGKHVLPRLLNQRRMFAYDFTTNRIPGVKDYEEHGYWRDVGTIKAYWESHQDLLTRKPRFDLFNPFWPIRSSNYDGPSAKIIECNIHNSIVGAGSLICGGEIRDSIIRREVYVDEDVCIENCIIMDYVMIKRGSRLKNVIVDRYNVIGPDTHIGFAPEEDKKHYHVDDESGIIVVSKGRRHLDPVY